MAVRQPQHVLPSHTASLETRTLKLAGEGFRLSLLLNAAACQISQSGIEIHSIAKGVSLFALALKELGLALDKPGQLNPSREAVDKICENASQGEGILNEIGGMLEKLKGMESAAGASLLQGVQRCFKRHYVTYLLAKLETLKLSLIVILQVLRLGKLKGVKGSYTDRMDEGIAEGKAEAQNMIVVRHYAAKRLNRLWELVENEVSEAEHDKPNQLSSHYPRIAAPTAKPSRLPVPSLGDNDNDAELASAMGRTPRDMVQLSERILNQLLFTMVLDEKEHLSSSDTGDSKARGAQKAYVSSDSDESIHSPDVDNGTHGYYLEGTTTDWRKPHSQEARQRAAQLRKTYAPYQAQVESDSEDSENMSPNTDDDALDFSDEEALKRRASQRPQDRRNVRFSTPPSMNRPHSFDGRQPSLRPPSYVQSPYPRPRGQQQQQAYQKQNLGIPHSTPVGIPVKHPPRGIPTQPDLHKQASSPRFSSPEIQHRHHSPARLYSSSNTNRSYQRLPSHRKPGGENSKDRHKLADGAAKGLLGVGAIAGFMDALEAFSAL